jgi:hypothetical protein
MRLSIPTKYITVVERVLEQLSLELKNQLVDLPWMLFWRVRNFAFHRALSTEQYQSALIVGLLCWPLNCMPCLPELYYSARILFRNWLCVTEFDWCGSLDTVVSMGMRRLTHLQEQDLVLLLSSVGTFECQAGGAGVVT